MPLGARMLSWLAIQPGEGRPALLAFIYLFLIISSYLMIKTVRNALFISEYGAMKLPYVMVGVAALAGVFAAGYIRLARQLTTWRLVFWSLIFFVSNLLLFWWLAIRGRAWLYPVIYMWAGVFGVIAPMQVWTLANELFTTRQAKRLFGFVGAGGILGGFSGGVLANRLAPLVGTSNLLLVVAGMLCLAALIVYIVASRGFVQPRTAFEAPPPQNLRQSLGVVFGSPHLRLLAALVFISALVTTSVDFQFNVIAERHVPERDELTAFFGAVYAGMALASFLVQILFTSRLLAWFGVGFVVLMLPCSLTVSTLVLLSTGTLWAGVFLKASDGSLKHSVDRSGRELLYLPVPSSIKIHAKSTIDTVMDRLGDGSAGMLQILLVTALGLGLQGSLAANLGLILVWLLVAVRLKHAYVRQLLSSIGKPRRLEFDAAVMQDADARQTLEGILGSGTDAEKLGALEWIYRESIEVDEGLLHDLIYEASSPALRRAALAALLGRSGVELSPELLADLEAEQKSTLISVIDLLAEQDPKRSRQRLDALLDTIGDTTRFSLVAFTMRRLGPEFEPMAERVFDAMLDPSVRPDARRSAVSALALLPPDSPLHDRLASLLTDEDPIVAGVAAETAGRLQRTDLAPELIAALARPGVRLRARGGLLTMGQVTVPALMQSMQNREMEVKVRRQIPRLLGELGATGAAKALVATMDDSDPTIRKRSLEALHLIRKSRPEIKPIPARSLAGDVMQRASRYETLTAAAEALDGESRGPDDPLGWLLDNLNEERTRLTQRIFDLLALEYPVRDMQRAWQALRDGGVRERANAVELVDTMLMPSLKTKLLPLLDAFDRTLPRSSQTAESYSRDEALRALAGESHPWIAACALFAARAVGLGGLEVEAARAAGSANAVLREEGGAYQSFVATGGKT